MSLKPCPQFFIIKVLITRKNKIKNSLIIGIDGWDFMMMVNKVFNKYAVGDIGRIDTGRGCGQGEFTFCCGQITAPAVMVEFCAISLNSPPLGWSFPPETMLCEAVLPAVAFHPCCVAVFSMNPFSEHQVHREGRQRTLHWVAIFVQLITKSLNRRCTLMISLMAIKDAYPQFLTLIISAHYFTHSSVVIPSKSVAISQAMSHYAHIPV